MNLGTRKARSKAVDVKRLLGLWREKVADGKSLKEITAEVNATLGSNFTEGSLSTKIEGVRQKMADEICETHKRTIESWKNAGPLGLKNWETFQEQLLKKINQSIPKPERANRTKAVVKELVDMGDFSLESLGIADEAVDEATNELNNG